MTPGERARFNSPITARQKVQAILDERLTDPHERVRHGLPEERKDKPDKEQRLSKEEREQELCDEGPADARQEYERIEEERLTRIIDSVTFVDYADKDPREIAAEEFDRMLQRVGSTGRAALTAVVNITQAIAEIAQERLDDFQDDEEEPSEQTGDDDGTDEPTDADPEHATPPGMPESHELEPTVHAAESLPPLAPGEWVRRNSLSYMREAAPFFLRLSISNEPAVGIGTFTRGRGWLLRARGRHERMPWSAPNASIRLVLNSGSTRRSPVLPITSCPICPRTYGAPTNFKTPGGIEKRRTFFPRIYSPYTD